MYAKKDKIYPVSKHNSNCKKQVIFLWFQIEKNAKLSPKYDDCIMLQWKKVSALLRGITSINNSDF